MERFQRQAILKDLGRKMVFVAGPRQVGKTWLAKDIAKSFHKTTYLNYDSIADKNIIINEEWLPETELLILDELHKMPEWKNFLKGVYDTKAEHLQILVTGSARLNTYREVGDSLAGREFTHRLLPFSPAELIKIDQPVDIERLLIRGGFPEPYLAEDDVAAQRWRMQYSNGLIRHDVLDFENIHDLRAIQLTLELLRHRVGSPISYKSIGEDIGVQPNTIKKYIQILEALYIVFRVTPYHRNIARSLLKQPKIYFYDVGMVEGEEGARFENLVAVCLLKHVYAKVDLFAEDYCLNYLRTKDGKEVDFALVCNNEIVELVETKLTNSDISKSLYYFATKHKLPATQLVKNLKRERTQAGIHIREALPYLCELLL